MMLMGTGESESYWRTQGMARAIGVDLTGAMVDGWLTRAGFGTMVMNCELCAHSGECAKWLSRHGAGSTALPEFCANKAGLEALRPA